MPNILYYIEKRHKQVFLLMPYIEHYLIYDYGN